MKQELDELLCEKYPKMLVNRNSPMTETCMCWGFECGDGWFNILDQLMGNIQHHLDWKNKKEEVVPQVTLDQIKEKFGTLRFYYTGGDDIIDGMVRMAESMSAVTCEECGGVGKRRDGGWIRTLCDFHEAEHQEAKRTQEMKWSGLEE
jgi:hypothetical protein